MHPGPTPERREPGVLDWSSPGGGGPPRAPGEPRSLETSPIVRSPPPYEPMPDPAPAPGPGPAPSQGPRPAPRRADSPAPDAFGGGASGSSIPGPLPTGSVVPPAEVQRAADVFHNPSPHVSLLASGLGALALAGAIYGVALLLKGGYLYGLLVQRGPAPYFTIVLFAWSAVFLGLKTAWILRQRQGGLVRFLERLPAEIRPDDTLEVLARLKKAAARATHSILGHRVAKALVRYHAHRRPSEVGEALTAMAESDDAEASSSYGLLRFAVWAMPILGFVGTVLGLGLAVAGFQGSLERVNEIGQVKDALNQVMAGLATAFDTTLVALVATIVVMLPLAAVQKAEAALLGRVDELSRHHVLARLAAPPDALGGGAGPGITEEALERAVTRALERVAPAGLAAGAGGGGGAGPPLGEEAIERAFVKALHRSAAGVDYWKTVTAKVSQNASAAIVQAWQEIATALKGEQAAFGDRLIEGIRGQLEGLTRNVAEAEADLVARHQALLEAMRDLKLHESVRDLARSSMELARLEREIAPAQDALVRRTDEVVRALRGVLPLLTGLSHGFVITPRAEGPAAVGAEEAATSDAPTRVQPGGGADRPEASGRR